MMATIQIGGRNPSAFGDIRSGGVQSGPSWYDDLAPTAVSASALVTNAGDAAGTVIMELRNMDVDPDGEVLQGDRATVQPASPDGRPGEELLSASIGIATDAVRNLGVFVIDTTTRPWKTLQEKTFTVNSYQIQRVSDLSSGGINISVT